MDIQTKDIDLSFKQALLLRKAGLFGVNEKHIIDSKSGKLLLECRLVERKSALSHDFVISEYGKMYFRQKRKSRFRFWIPVSISILALFSGYDVYKNPIIEAILKEAMSLLKTIAESLDAVL